MSRIEMNQERVDGDCPRRFRARGSKECLEINACLTQEGVLPHIAMSHITHGIAHVTRKIVPWNASSHTREHVINKSSRFVLAVFG